MVGAATLPEITAKLENCFKEWSEGAAPKKNIARVDPALKPAIYLMDKPDAQAVLHHGLPACATQGQSRRIRH